MYIGQTINSFSKRMIGHNVDAFTKNKENKWKHSSKLPNAIRKYGWENFGKYQVTLCFGDQEELNALECHYIDFFDTLDNGYNTREGGSKGRHTEESKNKMSKAWETRAPVSEETREKISINNKGRKLTQEHKDKIGLKSKGRPMSESTKLALAVANENRVHGPLSDEHKAKIGAVHKGKIVTSETRQKQSAAKKGTVASEATRKLMSEQRRGSKNAMFGRKRTEQEKKNIILGNSKSCRIQCVKEGSPFDGMIFDSMKEAGRVMGIHGENIAAYFRKNKTHYLGYQFIKLPKS